MKAYLKLLEYDLKQGFYKNRGKLLFCLITFAMFAVSFNQELNKVLPTSKAPHFIDYLLYLSKGAVEYQPDLGVKFDIPLIWLMTHLMVAFLVSNYLMEDLYSYGTQVLLRAKNKKLWWFSKCSWLVVTVLAFYCLEFLSIFLSVKGNTSLQPNLHLNEQLNWLNMSGMHEIDMILSVIVLPFLTSLALAMIQMYLSLFLTSIYAFVLVVSYLVLSTYYLNPFFIGNDTMFLRNALLYKNGIHTNMAIVSNICIILCIILIGAVTFNRHEILKRT